MVFYVLLTAQIVTFACSFLYRATVITIMAILLVLNAALILAVMTAATFQVNGNCLEPLFSWI